MLKKIKLSRILAVLSFIVMMGAVLFLADRIVRAKFIKDSTPIVNGFYAEKENDIDVVVIGSSNSFCTIDPVRLYEEQGVAAYDLGSSSQTMDISTLYLKEALKHQEPVVVALEVNMMAGGSILDQDEEMLRWGLTDIPLSVDKLTCLYRSLGRVDAEYFSYVFPIFRYHDRWRDLTKTDYTYLWDDKTHPAKGYLETQAVTETAVSLDDYLIDGAAWIEEENIAYLDEMARLCSEHGAELLLFKSPRDNWHAYETQAIRALADERGIRFVDYNELYHDGTVALDPIGDFRDGQHLNDFGAAKVTSHFGSYLRAHYGLPDRRGEPVPNSWDLASQYRANKGWQAYMGAQSAYECLELLQEDDSYVIMVTENTGKARRGHEQWVYQDGAVAFHKKWQEDGLEHLDVDEIHLVLSKKGMEYHVWIDSVDHYQIGARWNIIVYDRLTKEVTALAFAE